MSSLSKGLKNKDFQSKKSPISLNSKYKKRFKRVKSVNILREKEKQWDDRFIYDKILDYDSSNDKNVLLNFKTKCNSSRKKIGNIIHGIPLSFIDNSLYLYRPLSNKASIMHPLLNSKKSIKTVSARNRDINFITNRNIHFNHKHFLFSSSSRKRLEKLENLKKNEVINRTNRENENNFSNINILNLKNTIKLWDELCVNKNYRKLFCVIYKELDDDDKEELYQRETNEIISIKNDINTLKKNIESRLKTIQEIYELNKKLNTEIINKDNKSNEIIINDISNKIGTLRENTVNVCKSMKNLKLRLEGLKHLDKYNINIIAEKFQFDKNYLIKMKGEMNFLKEGFAKYYFNIKNDQTPFLLKASEKSKIDNDKDPFVHLVPLDKELKNDIMECSYYIYQELIAYQNEKVNNRILKCISPLKRIVLKNNEEPSKVINGINEKENNNINNNTININNMNNNSLNVNSINNNNKNNNENSTNNLNLNLIKSSSSLDNNNMIEQDENIEKKEKNEKNDIKEKIIDIDNIQNDIKNDINNMNNKKKEININRNDKKFKTGKMQSIKNKKNNYKNILLNYQINERNLNKNKTIINRKNNNNIRIDRFIIKNDNSLFSENNKNDEEDKKELNKKSDNILVNENENNNKIENNE